MIGVVAGIDANAPSVLAMYLSADALIQRCWNIELQCKHILGEFLGVQQYKNNFRENYTKKGNNLFLHVLWHSHFALSYR